MKPVAPVSATSGPVTPAACARRGVAKRGEDQRHEDAADSERAELRPARLRHTSVAPARRREGEVQAKTCAATAIAGSPSVGRLLVEMACGAPPRPARRRMRRRNSVIVASAR